MTRPKRSDAYPAPYLHALRKVAETGEDFTIPTASPIAMRLNFYGLFGALRAEGKPELPSLVSIFIIPPENGGPAITIRLKNAGDLAQDITKALSNAGEPPPETGPQEDEYEAAIARILGEKP